MYGLMGGRLRRWLEGNGPHRWGEASIELSAPAQRPDNGALPTNASHNEQSAAASQNTPVVAMDGSQEVLNEVEAKPSGASQAPTGTQINE